MSRRLFYYLGRAAGVSVFPTGVASYFYFNPTAYDSWFPTHVPLGPSNTATVIAGRQNLARTLGRGGDPYELVGTDGHTVRSDKGNGFLADQQHWTLLYFGFAKCAEICPRSVEYMSEVMNKDQELRGAFVSVDPLRDDVPTLTKFLERWGPDNGNAQKRMVGYVGDGDNTSAVARAWKVYFSFPDDVTADSDYQLDHSSYVFLLNPQGVFVDFFTRDMPVDHAVEKIGMHKSGIFESS